MVLIGFHSLTFISANSTLYLIHSVLYYRDFPSPYIQYGSRFIQQQMETATDDEKADVFAEIEGSAAKLMEDLFGNYVIQKFFEFGSTPQIEVLCDLLRCAVFKWSLQTYGCRVVQKAIECLPLELQVWTVLKF